MTSHAVAPTPCAMHRARFLPSRRSVPFAGVLFMSGCIAAPLISGSTAAIPGSRCLAIWCLHFPKWQIFSTSKKPSKNLKRSQKNEENHKKILSSNSSSTIKICAKKIAKKMTRSVSWWLLAPPPQKYAQRTNPCSAKSIIFAAPPSPHKPLVAPVLHTCSASDVPNFLSPSSSQHTSRSRRLYPYPTTLRSPASSQRPPPELEGWSHYLSPSSTARTVSVSSTLNFVPTVLQHPPSDPFTLQTPGNPRSRA